MTPADDPQGTGGGDPAKPLHTQPKTVALVFAAFLLIVGLPAGLYAWTGRTRVALGLLGLFVAMVLLSAYALKVASRVERARR